MRAARKVALRAGSMVAMTAGWSVGQWADLTVVTRELLLVVEKVARKVDLWVVNLAATTVVKKAAP